MQVFWPGATEKLSEVSFASTEPETNRLRDSLLK